MEKITYRKTLDVHKNGTQFTLQGFQTADKMSRVIEISLMASGDAIDFPLEGIQAVMYVSTPGAETPSRIECDIKDNKIIYNVLPITEEGTIIMQLKLIETSPGTSVLYSPKFAVEVSKSDGDVNDAEGSEIYTKFERTIQKADEAYNKAMTNFVLSADGIITITYRDGSTYESDFLKRINIGDNAALSESYAKGTAGVRQGEETDNAKYYSNVAKSEALNAKNIMSESRDVLDEVRLHGVYTSFSVDFKSGTLTYSSPKYDFYINKDTGELEADGKSFDIETNLIEIVKDWLNTFGVVFPDFKTSVDTLNVNVLDIYNELGTHNDRLNVLEDTGQPLKTQVENNTSMLTKHMGDISWIEERLGWISGETVWTNTESTLQATTIGVDLTAYKSFKVIYYEGPGTSEMTMTGRGTFSIRAQDATREITIKDDSISFTLAHGGFNYSDSVLVPKKIIGYKY